MLLHRLGRYLRHNLWLVPLLCVLGAIGLALAANALDRYFDYGLLPQTTTGNPNAAQSILNMIAFSMVTLTSIVLTLTLVVVQLAMGQFSPRIVRALLQDRRSQLTIGLFAGTFAYSMLVLREIDPQGSVLPGLAVVVAYVLALASIIVAFDELRLAGASSPQVTRRLRAALEDLKTVAPPDRQAVLNRQLDLLEEVVSQKLDEEEDISASLTGDQQGIGSGQDVTYNRPDGALLGTYETVRSARVIRDRTVPD